MVWYMYSNRPSDIHVGSDENEPLRLHGRYRRNLSNDTGNHLRLWTYHIDKNEMKKAELPIDKNKWHPSLIPGVITLISTISADGKPNIAPKSWVQMVSMEPSILMFSGSKGNTTENNIIQTKSFVVNIVSSDMAVKVFGCLQWFGSERIEKCGFTLGSSKKVSAPLISECKAHIECSLHNTLEIGSGLVVFGNIEAVSIDKNIELADENRKYELLDQILFLEDRKYAGIGKIRKI